MQNSRVILTACLLGALLSATAIAQEEDRDRAGRHPVAEGLRGGGRFGGGQGPMDGGMMAPELMQQTMIAQFIGNKPVADKLGITDEQRQQISDMIQASRTAQIRLRAEQEIAAMEQVRLLAADEVDEGAVMAAVEKTGQLSVELAKARILPIVKIRQILSPEQIAQAQEMIRKHVRDRRGSPDGKEGFNPNKIRRRGPPNEGGAPEGRMPPPPPEEGGAE